jgi:hypothetical protein
MQENDMASADDGQPFDEKAFDELLLGDDFIRGGAYEPPARTRAAIARYGNQKTSWRHGGGLNQQPPPRASAAAASRARFAPTSFRAQKGGRRRLGSWLPAVTALLVIALIIAMSSHHGL